MKHGNDKYIYFKSKMNSYKDQLYFINKKSSYNDYKCEDDDGYNYISPFGLPDFVNDVIEHLRTENDKLQQKLEAAKAKLQSVRAELKLLKSNPDEALSALIKQITDLEAKKEAANKAIKDAAEKLVAQKVKTEDDLRQKREAAEQELQRVQAEIATQRDAFYQEMVADRDELEEKRAALQIEEERLRQIRYELADREAQLSALATKVGVISRANTTNDRTIEI